MESSSETQAHFKVGEFFLISNLFSLFRIAIIPVLAYYLAKPDQTSALTALSILIIAGLTDVLDGLIARKLNQVSQLGMILDPLADKILAAALVIMLIFFRSFPIWLALVIIGRDLIILMAATVLLKRKQLVVPSNVTGKYAFFFIVVLLACYVVRFGFGVKLTTFISVVLLIFSMIVYARKFARIKREQALSEFKDRTTYQLIRVGLTAIILIVLIVKLYLFLT